MAAACLVLAGCGDGKADSPHAVRGPASPQLRVKPEVPDKSPKEPIPLEPVDITNPDHVVEITPEMPGHYVLGWRSGPHVALEANRYPGGRDWGEPIRNRAFFSGDDERLKDSMYAIVPVRRNAVPGWAVGSPDFNPQFWHVVDLSGRMERVSFPFLAVTGAWGVTPLWALGSASLPGKEPARSRMKGFDDDNIVFALAYTPEAAPVVRRNMEKESRDCGFFEMDKKPARSAPPHALNVQGEKIIKELMARDYPGEKPWVLCWHKVQAVLAKGAQPVTVWFANIGREGKEKKYLHGAMNVAFAEESGLMRLIWVNHSTDYTNQFHANPLAAVDLDGDGYDEIILRARYYESSDYRVYRLENNNLIFQHAYLGYGVGEEPEQAARGSAPGPRSRGYM